MIAFCRTEQFRQKARQKLESEKTEQSLCPETPTKNAVQEFHLFLRWIESHTEKEEPLTQGELEDEKAVVHEVHEEEEADEHVRNRSLSDTKQR